MALAVTGIALLVGHAQGCVKRQTSVTEVPAFDRSGFIRFSFAEVLEVLSPETVRVEDVRDGRIILRLAGVEAPVKDSMWFSVALSELRGLLDQERIVYYENPLQLDAEVVSAQLQVDTLDVNAYLLASGLARYRADGAFTERYRPISEEARVAGKGLWSGAPPASRPNNSVNPTVRPVTPRACARVAPVRPAGYAER
jgi:endonuclease YncB( thermonuclease family)